MKICYSGRTISLKHKSNAMCRRRLDTGLWVTENGSWRWVDVAIADGRLLVVKVRGHKGVRGFLGISVGGHDDFLVGG